MRRFNDYDVRLMRFASANVGQPFAWGRTNCGALAAGAIDAMFGSDLFTASISARCTSAARGLALSRSRATRSVLFGFGAHVVDLNYAQVGDIVVAFEDPWECSHVVLGKNCLSSSPEKGVFLIPTKLVLDAAFGRAKGSKPAIFPAEVFRCL